MNYFTKKIMIYISLFTSIALSIPIINNKCCVTYAYGSNMDKCCFDFSSNMELCDINSRNLGGVSEIYNNMLLCNKLYLS